MEENVANGSPMWNGDGVTSADDQTPVEEESMSTTVLKGDNAHINWPGSDGESEEVSPSADDIVDAVEDRTPSPVVDDIPPPRVMTVDDQQIDDDPEPIVEDASEPELEALAEPDEEGTCSPEFANDKDTLGLPNVQIIVTPGTPVPDECESPTGLFQDMSSNEEDHSSCTEEQSPDTPVSAKDDGMQEPVADTIITPEENLQLESSPDDLQESFTEDHSPEETTKAEQKPDEEQLEAQPIIDDPTMEEPCPEKSVTEDIKDSFAEDLDPYPNESITEEINDSVSEDSIEPTVTSLEEHISNDPTFDQESKTAEFEAEEVILEDKADPSQDDDLVKPCPEDYANLEKLENEDDTDSGTISEGGSTPKHAVLDVSVDMPSKEENISPEADELNKEEGEGETLIIDPEHFANTEELQCEAQEQNKRKSPHEDTHKPENIVKVSPQDVNPVVEEPMTLTEVRVKKPAPTWPEEEQAEKEHITYPETKEGTQSEALNGKEPVSADAFFDEAFGSETPYVTEEPERLEDKPPPIQEEPVAQTFKTDSNPSIDVDWPSDKIPEKPTEKHSAVTEPTENESNTHSTQSEKMGVKGDHGVETQHKDDEMMTGSDKENDSSQHSVSRKNSKRLDTNRFSHFNKSTEELDTIEDKPKAVTKKASITNRLDRSRFAKFEMNNQTNGSVDAPTPRKRNFVINKAAKKRFGSDSSDSGQPSSNDCCVCNKRVYPMEKITADNKPYHKLCFKCAECKKCLSLGNYASLNGCLYCKPHFTQLFKLKGNYNDGFAPGASKTFQSKAQSEESLDSPDSSLTKDATSPGASSDNTDIVRSRDELKETRVMTSPGGLRSVKDQFEGGTVSNVEVKKMMDEEVIRPTTMQCEEGAPEGVHASGISENEPVVRDDVVHAGTPSDDQMSASGGTRSLLDRFEKGEVVPDADSEDDKLSPKKVDVSAEIEEAMRREEEVRRSEPTVSENEPAVRDDVVRSGDASEDIKLGEGALGSLKDRFEKGTVSNLEDTPKREPIKIGNLEDLGNENETSSMGTVSENTPVVRDDVVHSTDTTDDPGIKAGTSRSLKAMFEKGPVSNLEQKPKDKIDISPRSLDESHTGNESAAVSGISENTPIVRDDVVKSSSTQDDPEIKVGGLKNLRSLFEKGNHSNIEEKPRQVEHHTPQSLDTMDPSDQSSGIAENTPVVRDDLVRESSTRDDTVKVAAGHSRSLRNRWEKGEVERPEANYKTIINKEESQVAESQPEPQREDVVTGSLSPSEVQIETGSSKSLKDRFESGEAFNAGVSLRVPKDVPKAKRFSAYNEPDADNETQQENGSEALEEQQYGTQENGMQQNGDKQVEEQNGIIIDEEMSPLDEGNNNPPPEMASWEIKAARASALADSPIDGEETMNM